MRFHNPGGTNFTLGPRANREIVLSLESGEDFSQSDVERAGEDAVFEFEVTVGDFPVGGMSYIIDPKLKEPALELPPRDKEPDCTDAAEDLLECLNLPTDEVKSVRVRRITVDIDLKDDC